MRRNAKDERVLFHFNGHGVPRPTDAGEIWVFDKNITQVGKKIYKKTIVIVYLFFFSTFHYLYTISNPGWVSHQFIYGIATQLVPL
jgi:hypothetical protein